MEVVVMENVQGQLLEDAANARDARKQPETTHDTQVAVQALEVLIAAWLGVCFSVASVVYTTTAAAPPSAALGSLLKLLGSVHVDVCAFYFLLKGYSTARFISVPHDSAVGGDTELQSAQDEKQKLQAEYSALIDPGCRQWAHVRGILRDVLPDLVLSSLLHGVVQAIVCGTCVWDWVNIMLSPLFLSPFADVREGNVFRAPSEISWIVQNQTLMLLLTFELHDHVMQHTGKPSRVPWVLALVWLT
eukprot:2102523-Rhodomonas_salina.1